MSKNTDRNAAAGFAGGLKPIKESGHLSALINQLFLSFRFSLSRYISIPVYQPAFMCFIFMTRQVY
ncbi:MAG: hypothetical protein E7I63_13225 [Citrobacter koseri]|uniref:hypothetical protein n=1 Tax=Citrobacter koseri TaxID=545 RepID=UPI001A1F7154|nr:hypothetical protein [Citrobacter koseri]MDT7493827.1 hypothetical protein [Citrobacter koseri]MDU4401711.1 hypothetical protein [Citrobacter koseri]HAT7525090.1 hypothetical protein [Citrobacter koseri]HBD7025034.1 hypothetical protein [Citrobacter koseri]HEI8998861.1 hypothetical protein [Citrobacter koseri]